MRSIQAPTPTPTPQLAPFRTPALPIPLPAET